MKKNGIFWGILLILAALYLVLRGMGLVVELPIWTILITIILGAICIHGIIKVDWFGIFMPLSLIGCVYLDEINALIQQTNNQADGLDFWVLIATGLLLSFGFSMIFKKKHNGHFENVNTTGNPNVENFQDGSVINITNNFNGKNKYVNTQYLERANIENNFGECNVYFDNAVISGREALIVIENNFGETNIYLPKMWRVEMLENGIFSNIQTFGVANSDLDAPLVKIKASANFGQINIRIN
ncbi:MAG: LiaF-related protein [Lachnospiraceae bacterium]|nr:LiaF-related protein [Lachnospiraceae bacterium]MDD6505262.1 LiaF-related protein [Lachnospiraceae bacterium]